MTANLLPHRDAPLWVWHAWLVHGARPCGGGGTPCPDGCDQLGEPRRTAMVAAQDLAEQQREDAAFLASLSDSERERAGLA